MEDLFGADLYCDLINQALDLKGARRITADKAAKADPGTQRIVKQVEAACRCIPPNIQPLRSRKLAAAPPGAAGKGGTSGNRGSGS